MIVNDNKEIEQLKKIEHFKVSSIEAKTILLDLPVKLITGGRNIDFETLVFLATQHGMVYVKRNKKFQYIVLVFFKKAKNNMKYEHIYFKITDPKVEKELLEYIKIYDSLSKEEKLEKGPLIK